MINVTMRDDSFVNTVTIEMAERKLREPDTSKTRQSIVDAADAIIAERGLNGTSVSAVARALGMSHANVYRHFSSRDAVLKAVADSWMRDMQTACEEAVQACETQPEKLAALVFAIRSQLKERSLNPVALDLYKFAREEMPEQARAHHAHRGALVTAILGRDEHTSVVLDALRGFTDPFLLSETSDTSTEQRVRDLTEFLCRVR